MENDNKAYDKAQKKYEDAKSEASIAWKAVKAYQKEHALKPGYKADKTAIGKGYAKLVATHKELSATRDELETAAKKLKPKATSRTMYDYPADVKTADEKKKYRQLQRSLKKKAEKGEAAPATEEKTTAKKGKGKKAKETAAPEPEVKTAKKGKAGKAKAKKAAADEDED